MGAKSAKPNPSAHQHETVEVQSKTVVKQKGAGCCGCFGAKKQFKQKQKTQTKVRVNNSQSNHRTKKSQIIVKSVPNAKIDNNLFQGRQKQLLDIRLKRLQPYEIQKDENYFDSEFDDREDLHTIHKVHGNCEIANYQTPQTQKLQTVQVKTYVFDRNLTKVHK